VTAPRARSPQAADGEENFHYVVSFERVPTDKLLSRICLEIDPFADLLVSGQRESNLEGGKSRPFFYPLFLSTD
jgi:hypothetical protein